MPPLRDRREDLGTLIAAILPRVSPRARAGHAARRRARALFRYRWPLNIRELEQALRAAAALCDGRPGAPRAPARRRFASTSRRRSRPWRRGDAALRERLIAQLRAAGGNVAAVGRAMDRAPIQIRRWCQRLQIDLSQFRH